MASAANEWIFISYRRDDTAAQATWLADQLRQRFSGGAVFLDQHGIDWGLDFDTVLAHRVNAALAVLVLIGPQWLAMLQARAKLVAQAGSARDYVRMELAAALARAGSHCMVLPLLCGTASMPEASALKAAGFDDLEGLSTKNGPNGFLLDPIDLAGQAGAVDAAVLARLYQRIDEAATTHSGRGDQSRGGVAVSGSYDCSFPLLAPRANDHSDYRFPILATAEHEVILQALPWWICSSLQEASHATRKADRVSGLRQHRCVGRPCPRRR